MSGFGGLLLLYVLVWLVLLAPGGIFLARLRARPDDEREFHPRTAASVRRALATAPVTEPEFGRKFRRAAEGTASVDGLEIQDSEFLVGGAIVSGDLLIGEGGGVCGDAWAKGNCVLGVGAKTASLIVDGDLEVGEGATVNGDVFVAGTVTLLPDAKVEGTVRSPAVVLVHPGARARSIYAKAVITPPDPNPVAEPVPNPGPSHQFDAKDDETLRQVWSSERLIEIVTAFAIASGKLVRGYDLMSRARELGLLETDMPARPNVLGSRPAWILDPQVIRVGADLRVPPEVAVGYTIVAEGSLEVFQDAMLEADVYAQRGVLIHARGTVVGSVSTDGLAIVEEGSWVGGPLDSAVHALLFANARINGSVRAGGLIGLEPGARIHGNAIAGIAVRGEKPRGAEEREAAIAKLPSVGDEGGPEIPETEPAASQEPVPEAVVEMETS